MTNPGGRIWVDPDGVGQLGEAYGEQVELYQDYLTQLTALRERYADAWGDDEMGTEFATKFLAGLDNLEKLIGGVKGTLEYTAQGLVAGGRMYRLADDEARDTTFLMSRDFESDLTPHAVSARLTERAEQVSPPGDAEPPPGTQQFARVLARPADAAEPPPGTQQFAQILARPADPVPVEPVEVFHGTPMTSAMLTKPEFFGATIDGEPLPEGYDLIALIPLGDGTTRLDANLYESITPLGDTTVTGADGRPIDPEGRHLFVVQQNEDVDPTADGYEPFYLGYAADGTPTPLITDE